jgi:hypothetical protein
MTGLLLLSAAGLTFQVNLIRLFSVSQFYHFAFMIVSIAMLGYGASGTVLAINKRLSERLPQQSLISLSLATAVSIMGSYILINRLPFDSFSIAWDSKQVWILIVQYGVLASPFFFNGMAVGSLLASYPHHSGRTYAVNLFGSALGCLFALLLPSYLGGEGVVTLSCGMATLAAVVVLSDCNEALIKLRRSDRSVCSNLELLVYSLVAVVLFIFVSFDLSARARGKAGNSWLELHLSPYKSLSYALQAPGADVVYQKWNSFSRIDLVSSPSIHSYPGLSYRYLQSLPPADGMTVDGDDLIPILRPTEDMEFTGFLPVALAYQLRPGAEALLLEPRGGPDIQVALEQGAQRITVVEINPLIVSAAGEVYDDPRLQVVIESGRSFLRWTSQRYDVIVLSLTNSYHPVRSGAYSLAEDYRYTVEAFQDALNHLKPDGVLVAARWLQTPPSESLRTFALAVEAVERCSGNPHLQIVALRGYNIATLLVKNSPFTTAELIELRQFNADRAFDLIYAPDIKPQEVNLFNILPEPVYYQTFMELLNSPSRVDFYRSYAFNVNPPTDDHPFYGHFFKWSQAGQIFAEMGKVWQPFGGAGYFIVLALLALAVLMAGILILLPAAVSSQTRSATVPALAHLVYFGLIGFGFMLVEMPLIQRFILFLGHPAYAVTAVLFSLLAFSALGSHFSARTSLQLAIGGLVALLLIAPRLLPGVFQMTLGLPLTVRLGVTALVIAPIGFLIGIPFPGGIKRMLVDPERSSSIPWIWAVNGAASVVSSVLATLLALSFGFDWVLRTGALCYAGAWLAINMEAYWGAVSPLRR